MSLVGTRPILQDELLKYELHHRARIAIKPGITGMWQVSGRSDITDFEEVVRLDTEYISTAYSRKFAGLYETLDPLSSISELDVNKKYAFIGKPCDVTVLKNFQKLNPIIAEMIPITMSFFCAGLPSIDAQKKLLEEMGCNSRVVSLRYRGNGWPGYATANLENGKQCKIDYNTSWGKILGRDIMKMCRFCLDGIGEMTDIACCDAWYLTEDNKPNFTEADGRNGIICRSNQGVEIVQEASALGKLVVTEFTDYEEKLKHIAWVFGLNGKNFIKTMLNVGKTHDTVRVVNDQIGTPTYTYDLAQLLVDMNETEKYGYYHATNEGGYISWYDFTKEIYRQAGYKTEVLPVTTAEYGLSKAARPFNSRLDKSKLVEAGFTPLPTWQDALSRYLKEIEQ